MYIKIVSFIWLLLFTACTHSSSQLPKEAQIIPILCPATFRIYNRDDPTKNLNNTWIELYKEQNNYFLAKADYTIESGYDNCSGDSTKTITTHRNTFLFLNDTSLSLGEIKGLNLSNTKILPNETAILQFNNRVYTLRAKGKLKNTGDIEDDIRYISDYELWVKTDNSLEELLFRVNQFTDTFAEIIFVGDIDRDKQLDFIFSVPRHYEEDRLLLFLSSKASERKILYQAGELVNQHDC